MTTSLTPEMRAFLRSASNAALPTWDMISKFMTTFNLEPEAAGRLIGLWIEEVM